MEINGIVSVQALDCEGRMTLAGADGRWSKLTVEWLDVTVEATAVSDVAGGVECN